LATQSNAAAGGIDGDGVGVGEPDGVGVGEVDGVGVGELHATTIFFEHTDGCSIARIGAIIGEAIGDGTVATGFGVGSVATGAGLRTK
jgi:hypothetical protein